MVVGDLIQQDEASGRERGVRGSGSGSALSLLISVAPRPASQQSSSLILIRVGSSFNHPGTIPRIKLSSSDLRLNKCK